MTLEEAFETERELILTIDPPSGDAPYKVTMIRPYCIFEDGLLCGEVQDGTDLAIYAEFVSNVELGEEIR